MKTVILSAVLTAPARFAMVLSADTAQPFTSFSGHVMADMEVGK
jgi:hypothetical protein